MLSAPITKNQIDPWCLRYHRSHPDQNLCYLASLDSLGTTDDEMRVTSARHIEQLNSVMDGISCCPLADFPLGNAEPSPAISTCLRCLPFHGPANTVSFVIFVEHLTLLPWYNTSLTFDSLTSPWDTHMKISATYFTRECLISQDQKWFTSSLLFFG